MKVNPLVLFVSVSFLTLVAVLFIRSFDDLILIISVNFSLSECYFAVKGAAVILPQSESIMNAAHPKTASSSGGEKLTLSHWLIKGWAQI